jgi:hypothetical protein
MNPTSSLTHLLVILQRYYKMLGPTIIKKLKCYFCAVFSIKLISRTVKLQLYNTLFRPTVTYTSETWVLKEHVITFGEKITRKIYGATETDDGYWRIKTDQEIDDIMKGQNIIEFIKKQRLCWLGHVERMSEDNNVQKIKGWKPMSKQPIGRPKMRWGDR